MIRDDDDVVIQGVLLLQVDEMIMMFWLVIQGVSVLHVDNDDDADVTAGSYFMSLFHACPYTD